MFHENTREHLPEGKAPTIGAFFAILRTFRGVKDANGRIFHTSESAQDAPKVGTFPSGIFFFIASTFRHSNVTFYNVEMGRISGIF